jgi:hypothetical protein
VNRRPTVLATYGAIGRLTVFGGEDAAAAAPGTQAGSTLWRGLRVALELSWRGHRTWPQLWIRVKVVPHLPGSANSASTSWRSAASSSSLRTSSRRDSSATLN